MLKHEYLELEDLEFIKTLLEEYASDEPINIVKAYKALRRLDNVLKEKG